MTPFFSSRQFLSGALFAILTVLFVMVASSE